MRISKISDLEALQAWASSHVHAAIGGYTRAVATPVMENIRQEGRVGNPPPPLKKGVG